MELDSNPGSPSTPTLNLPFSYLGRGAFSPKTSPNLATSKGRGSASPARTTSPGSTSSGLRAPDGGAGGGAAPPPGYLTPGWSARGAGRSCSSPLAPPHPPPRALPAHPTLRPALAWQAGTGRRARGAGNGARAALASAERPPGRGRSALPGRSATRQPESGRRPVPCAPRTGGGLWTPGRRHGFGFRRAERGRARDRRRYEGSQQPSREGWGRWGR